MLKWALMIPSEADLWDGYMFDSCRFFPFLINEFKRELAFWKIASTVLETCFYWRSRVSNKDPSLTPRYDSAVMVRGVSGGPEVCLHDAK